MGVAKIDVVQVKVEQFDKGCIKIESAISTAILMLVQMIRKWSTVWSIQNDVVAHA